MKSRGVFLVNSLLIYFVLAILGTTAVLPAWSEELEPWGTRSYQVEKPIYDQKVKKLQQEVRKAGHRKEQSRSQLTITLGDISGADYQDFEEWYNEHGNRPPVLIRQLEEAKEKLDDARQSFEIYATSNGPGADDVRFGVNVRDSLWPAHLKMLRAQATYYDLQAWDEKSRLLAAKKYTYSLYVQLYENAITGMQYVMRRHAEKFFGDLADCFGRALVQGVGGTLLAGYSHLSASQYPSWLTFDKEVPGYRSNSITGTDGLTLRCLDDATRNAIVGATTNGIRYNFVSKISKTWHVPEEIAEFWWAEMINPGDSPDSPWTPHYKSMYDRVTEGVMAAVKRAADKNNLIEHSKDFVKFQWERQIRDRVARKANESALKWLKEARKNSPGGLTRNDINRNAANAARYQGRKAVEEDTSTKWLKAADYAILAFETTFKSVYLNAKKAQFEVAAEPIVKEYQRIVTCLGKLHMSTNSRAVINIYKLKNKKDVADFFARCEGQTPDQLLARGHEIGRELYGLLEQARHLYESAYTSCESALGAAAWLMTESSNEDVSTTGSLTPSLAEFRQKVATIEANARQGFSKGAAVGKAKAAAEQAALQACESMGVAPRASNMATSETTARNVVAATRQAHAHRTVSATTLNDIEALARITRTLVDQVSNEANTIAEAASAPPSADDMQSLIAMITEKLAASRAAGERLPGIAGKAAVKYDEQVAVLTKLDDATADRVLDDGLMWLTEIRDLAKTLSDCQGQVQAALDRAPEGNGPEATPENGGVALASTDVAALRAKAEAAAQDLNTTLDLAKSYDEAAQTAAGSADLCLILAHMRIAFSQAQSADKTARTACDAGQRMADKAGGQLSLLQGEIKALDAKAKSRGDALLKMEALADKASRYSSDANAAATSARHDQTSADRLADIACQRLKGIKSAQSVSEVRAILGEIENAVWSCMHYAQRVRKSASDAEGAASACAALETALGSMTPPAPLATIDGKARTVKGEIDALDAVAGAAESRIAVVEGARGQANDLLARGQATASVLGNTDLNRTAVGEMGGIINRINGIQGKISTCSGEVRARIGELNARQAVVQSSELALSTRIRQINGRLQSGHFLERAREATKTARNFAEIAGWSADGMGEILSAIAFCQVAAEKALAQANAAQAACAQRPRMKAIPNPSGAGWVCTCIDPKDQFSEQVGGCVANNCPKLEKAFFGALTNKQFNRAGSILKQADSCGFAKRGASLLNSAYQDQRAEADAQRQQYYKNMMNILRDVHGDANQLPPPSTTSRSSPSSRPSPPSGGGSGSCSGSGSGISLLCQEAE